MAPKQMCQIFQALLMLQLKPSSMPLFVQPPALLQMCRQVSTCTCMLQLTSHISMQNTAGGKDSYMTVLSCTNHCTYLRLLCAKLTSKMPWENQTQLNMFAYCQASQLGKHWILHQHIPCQCSDALRQLKSLFDSLLVSFTFILRSHPFKFSSSSPVRQQCAGIGFHEGCGSQSGSTASS